MKNPATEASRAAYYVDPMERDEEKSDKISLLYPTPVYSSKVDNYEEIQEEIAYSLENGVVFNMNDVWASHYLSDITFELNVIEHFKLHKFMTELAVHIQEYCKYLNHMGNCKIAQSWYSLFNPGNYGHVHHHAWADISGVYYHKTNGEDGNLFFDSPNPHLSTTRLYQNLTPRHQVKPVQGHLLLFPGWLMHGIQTNTTQNERISLSFNIEFER